MATWMSEDDLKRSVLDLCKLLGIHTAHFRPALTKKGWRTPVEGDGKGFVDLVAVGRGGVLFRELKSATGKPSAEQAVWLEKLAAAGADVAVWRPRDLADGTIAATLARIAKPRAEVAS